MSGYVELHLHTAYSLLDGASLPEELIQRAVALGYHALAVTDHDGLYGAMEFAQLAQASGIQPITGAELTLVDASHLTLIVETQQGYGNLCRLITAAYRHTRPVKHPHRPLPAIPFHDRGVGKSAPRRPTTHVPPALDPALLAEHADGLILLTGCRQGKLARLVDAGEERAAEALLRRYVDWFGVENVVVELQHNLVFGDAPRIARLVRLADRVGVGYAATGDVHYHHEARHRLQDVLTAVRLRSTLDGCRHDLHPNSRFYLRPQSEVEQVFADYPQALAATVAIAERCRAFDLTSDLNYRFPSYPTAPNQTPDDVLAEVCRTELARRYPDTLDAAEARLQTELAVIAKHQLSGFFLLYRDLLRLATDVADEIRGTDSARARAHLPPGRGRGSSVGSIVFYLIGLSHVDPLKHDLMFGRFLNDELASVPDIDLDFPREIREKLIERVYETWPDRAALVCAFPTYHLRSAVRDIGKSLGIPASDLALIAKVSENGSARTLREEIARIPAYAPRLAEPPWSHLVELAAQLAGFPRHVNQHSGGMIVSATPLNELVPIQPAAMTGRWLCQWDKDSCDDARFVKIDFLALGMLSLVEECLELIADGGKAPVDLSRIDLADPAVYAMIQAGDTIGTFQVESRAQIQTLLKTQPRNLDDLAVQVAIVRPGPVVGGAVRPYVEHRTANRRSTIPIEPTYAHPLLEPVLEETAGMIIFQEQVLGVAMALAGFTPGQAEALRKAMTRKRSREAMQALALDFRDGALARGVDIQTARTVFKKLLAFSGYGFPKAHACAFAVLAYQSAWLKRYYPVEFLCALLNNQPMGFYPPHVLVNDGKRRGIQVRPPDIVASTIRCGVEPGGYLRIGLGYVNGLGDDRARQIVRERAEHGPYRSLPDLIRRVPLPAKAVAALINVGAVDRFGLGRREALWMAGLFVPDKTFGGQPGSSKSRGRQVALPLPVEQDAVALPPMTAWERMVASYAGLGLSPHFHPFGLLRPHLQLSYVTSAELETLADGLLVRVAGLVVVRQRPETAHGITFLLIEDETGLANVIVPVWLYQAQRPIVRSEGYVVVTGRLQGRDNVVNILATGIARLNAAEILAAAPRRAGETEEERQEVIGLITPAAHSYR